MKLTLTVEQVGDDLKVKEEITVNADETNTDAMLCLAFAANCLTKHATLRLMKMGYSNADATAMWFQLKASIADDITFRVTEGQQ